jgi:hypothetical protein
MPALGHEDVGGLDVAMEDPVRVRRFECIRQLDAKFKNLCRGQRTARDQAVERHPFQELHRDEVPPVMLSDVVHHADVRMIDRRGGQSLALEPFDCAGIVRQLFREELQCDDAAQPGVLGLVDLSHAPRAQLLHDAVMRDGFADHQPSDILHNC